jgi:xylulokinase
MQILADITGRKIETVCEPQEAGAVGVALVAAVGMGIYPDFESLRRVVKVDSVYEPEPGNSGIYDSMFRRYQEVYHNLRTFYRKLNKERIDRCDRSNT